MICITKNGLADVIYDRRPADGYCLVWHEYNLGGGILLNTFKWQLHIAILVIVVNILPPIVHGKKIEHVYSVVPLPMLLVMGNKHRQLE